MRKIWLITTEHLEKELLFRDDDDFKAAMNFVAIQAACMPQLSVLSFILMSNHVHFVLKGSWKDADGFITKFKHRYSCYYAKKWGKKKIFWRNGVDIKEIPYDDEATERAVAYVQMNCVAANICVHPGQYPWGTGNCFFDQTPTTGTPLEKLSARACERTFHTNSKVLPPTWHLSPDGYIPPQEYVDRKTVEELFRSPKRMSYFLSTSSKARRRMERSENLPAFRDQIILAAAPDLCRSLFQKDTFQQLSAQEKTEFMRQIRFRFSADLNQIARICGLSYAEAAIIFDSV